MNDLAPDPRWLDGRVALLGDACHAVQPNLGQGGGQVFVCSTVASLTAISLRLFFGNQYDLLHLLQAIESAFVLGLELAKVRLASNLLCNGQMCLLTHKPNSVSCSQSSD